MSFVRAKWTPNSPTAPLVHRCLWFKALPFWCFCISAGRLRTNFVLLLVNWNAHEVCAPWAGLLRVALPSISGPISHTCSGRTGKRPEIAQGSSLKPLSPWAEECLVWQVTHRMDESVPMDLLTSKGRSMSSAGGWREAGLARHVNAQDWVSLFV